MAKDTKPNTEAIKDAAAQVGETAEAPAPEVVQEVLPPYLFGENVPEAILNEMVADRIVRLDPEFLSVARGFNVRDFNARENVERVTWMKESLLANGQENPIKVRVIPATDQDGARIVVVAGETRLRAVRALREEHGAASFPSVAVVLAPDKSEADRAVDFIVDNSGKELSMLETLSVVNRLKAEGWKPAEIGRRTGLSHTAIGNLRILDYATPAIRQAIADGWLSASYVVERLRETEGEPEKVNLVEKKLLRIAEKNKEAGTQAARGRKAAAEGEEGEGEAADARKTKDGIIFNRGTFNALVSALQDVYATLVPPKEHVKQRKIIKTALDNCGAPTINPAAKKVAAEVAAAEEDEALAL